MFSNSETTIFDHMLRTIYLLAAAAVAMLATQAEAGVDISKAFAPAQTCEQQIECTNDTNQAALSTCFAVMNQGPFSVTSSHAAGSVCEAQQQLQATVCAQKQIPVIAYRAVCRSQQPNVNIGRDSAGNKTTH